MPGYTTATEAFDGTTWTEVNNLGTGVAESAGIGSGNLALTAGGQTPSYTNISQEWSFPSGSIVQLGQVWFNTGSSTLKGYAAQGTGSWSSGTSLNTARAYVGSAPRATQNAALAFGGDPNGSAITETYDGSSWTEVGDLNTPRAAATGAGTQTSALASTGFPSTGKDKVESWNGSSWTELAEPNLPRDSTGGTGASNTSAMIFGGYNPPQIYENETEVWDGTSWTEVGDLNKARRTFGTGAGITTSAMSAGGSDQPSVLNNVETWDGTSWTEITEVNAAISQGGLASDGTNTNVLRFGGEIAGSPNSSATTEQWNGSSWTELGDMGTARYAPGGNGTPTLALAFGGYTSTDVANTEEWTVPGALKTLASTDA